MTDQAGLRQRIMWNLGVTDETETPSTEQAALLDIYIADARGQLLEEGLCWWDMTDIPASVTAPFARVVAGECCDAFGKAGKGHEAKAAIGKRRLAALKSSEERATVRAEYF